MITSAEIASRLNLHTPTEEQRAVIEADHQDRHLVVAGAGSGKTETMSNRVVWLLANGLVETSQILGLTFTRKAAGELAERIRRRIGELFAAGIADISYDPLESATVSTYNSFASAIYREHALRIGREPDATLLSEASAWQLCRSVCASADDPRVLNIDLPLDQITGAVLSLSRALSENVVDSKDVKTFVNDFLQMSDLPIGAPRKKTPYVEFTSALEVVEALPPLLEMADAYRATKRARGYVEFSDQIAFALEICESNPEVVDSYRERYRTVLLDEYQDTSVVQTKLLSKLFSGQPVMAVGDPDQSIYGWRGASAANLARFSYDFTSPEADSENSRSIFHLATSWRNSVKVLEVANTVIDPGRAKYEGSVDAAEVTKTSVATKAMADVVKPDLISAPSAIAGSVVVSWTETIEEEADQIAQWFAQILDIGNKHHNPPTAALLCRFLTHVDKFVAALQARGVPFQVLGIAGLLEQPVIADLVCALRVLHDPTAGAELIRILSGARWAIGAADLDALAGVARWLAERDASMKLLGKQTRGKLKTSAEHDESPSLVDALDFLVSAPNDHHALSAISSVGIDRLRRAGTQIQALRRRTGLTLIDFVSLVQQELQLDIEVIANSDRRLGQPSLEAFDDLLIEFVETSERATLGEFLGWIAEAEKRDRLAPRQETAIPGAVQIMTIHGAKGLEWDYVAVPRLVADELPSKLRSQKGWLSFGQLPNEFRGDSEELPELVWRGVQSQNEFVEALSAFKDENVQLHFAEERRLAYVAVTRARNSLLLSGSWWAAHKTPRQPSSYLQELVSAGAIQPARVPTKVPTGTENPRGVNRQWVNWPLDPLGSRRSAVEQAAQLVRAAADQPTGTGISKELATKLELLLEERRRGGERSKPQLPVRVSASRFKDYVADLDGVTDQLRRPMPKRPFHAARVGTLFHDWVEHRSLAENEANALDSWEDADWTLEPGTAAYPAGETDKTAIRIEHLRRTFAESEWGMRKPLVVELELHLPIDDHVFVCKIDAVYEIVPGTELAERGFTHQIVDWKTGRRPSSKHDLELKQTQLALYRLAYAQYTGIDPDKIDCLFYFVEDDTQLRPETIYSEPELRKAWAGVITSAQSGLSG